MRALVVAVALIGGLAVSCAGAGGDREATELEFAYSYFAAKTNMPEICDKISPQAYLAAPWGGKSHQISYTRSDCYFNLALESRNADYCDEVVPKKKLFLDGSRNTPEQCRERVSSGRGLQSSGGDPDLLLRHMGYPDEQLRSTSHEDRCFHYPGMGDYHYRGRIPAEFRQRVRFLPDFSQGDPDFGALLTAAREHDRAHRSEHIDDLDGMGMSALHRAAYDGRLDCLQALLEAGASLDVRTRRGESVLDAASRGGHGQTIEYLESVRRP